MKYFLNKRQFDAENKRTGLDKVLKAYYDRCKLKQKKVVKKRSTWAELIRESSSLAERLLKENSWKVASELEW